MWAHLAVLVVSYFLNRALAPKPPQEKPASLEEFDFPLCKENEPKTAVFGQVWTKSWMVLTVGNYRSKRVRIGGGKK